MQSPKETPPRGLNPRDALDILEIRAGEIQAYLAQHPDTDAEVLEYLARHGAPAVRQAVAANIATPARANRILADDTVERVRIELAIKIARLMPGLGACESEHVIGLTIKTLETLANDSAVKVRAILAEEIKHLNCIPQSVALALAKDLEASVAVPVLEYSPLLSDTDLMEIIACGQVEEKLTAIARRKPLSKKLSDALFKSLDVPAIAALLVNPDSRIRKKTMDDIIAQAEHIDVWHLPLALRADLSARAIRRIAGFVGVALIELLSRRGGLDDATQAFLKQRLKEKLDHQASPEGQSAESAAREVAAAKAAGKLDEMFVDDAVFAGKRETVIHALAALAGAPVDTARKILSARGPKPMVALAWRAGISMRVAFKIQGLIMKLPASDLLHAKGGVHFPMKPEEMRWHLNHFNLRG